MAVGTGKIRGPWRWVGSFQPDGQSSFDMTAWQDTDGTGYLVRSVGNSYLGVSRLNENFTDTEGICTSTYQVQQLISPPQKYGQCGHSLVSMNLLHLLATPDGFQRTVDILELASMMHTIHEEFVLRGGIATFPGLLRTCSMHVYLARVSDIERNCEHHVLQ